MSIILKTSGNLWQYYRGETCLNNVGTIIDVGDNNNSVSFKFKQKMTVQTAVGARKDKEIMFLLKYVSNFLRTLEMPLSNCEIDLVLTWSANCVISSIFAGNQAATYSVTDAKLYVPIVTLWT